MKGRVFLLLALLSAMAAVLAQYWPLDRTPPGVQIQPPPGRYDEEIQVTLTSEPGADIYMATGDNQPMPYITPLRIRRDTVVRYFARDRFGNHTDEKVANYEVHLDTSPPVSAALPGGGEYHHPVSVRLLTEEGGVIHYTIDGSEPTRLSRVYEAPLAVRKDTTIRFFAEDRAGNAEPVKKAVYTIKFDNTKPVTLAAPSGGVYRGPVKVSLSSEEGTTVFYTVDGSRPSFKSPEYSQPIEFVRSGVLRFFAVDAAGNKEKAREESYVIDSQPPSVKAEPPGGTYSGEVKVVLKSSERGAIRYEVGDGDASMASPVYKAPLKLSGTTVLSYFAVDEAGNKSPVMESDYVIDNEPPRAVSRPPGGKYSGRIRVKIESSEPADIYYTLDGSKPSENSSRYKDPITINSNTILSYFAVDKVGNRGASESQSYIFDSSPPETRAEPPGGIFSGEVTVTLAGEEGSVVHYTLDGTTPTEASPVYEKPIKLLENTQLKFYGTDESGNREEVRTEKYTFDATPSSTSIAPAPGSYNRPVRVTLTSENGGTIFIRRPGQKDFAVYTGPFMVERTEKILYYTVDDKSRREASHVAEYVIDTDPPRTVSYPAPGQYGPPLTLELRTETGAKIHYTLDGTQPTETSSVYRMPLVLENSTTARYFAVDSAGNSEKPRSSSYTLTGGMWRSHSRGVFKIPSLIYDDYLWVGGEGGLSKVWIDTGNVKNYTTADGLAANSVRAIAEDRDGFLWIGTDKGVSRFDGNSDWDTYDTGNGMPSNHINCIVPDSQDKVWIGTDRGLVMFDRGKFIVSSSRQGLPDDNVTSIAIDAEGVFWIGTSGGLLRQDGSKREIFTTSSGLPSDDILSVGVDGMRNVWVGTLDGKIARYDGGQWTVFTQAQGVPRDPVRVIVRDLADNVWFGTDTGAYKYDGHVFTKSEAEVYR